MFLYYFLTKVSGISGTEKLSRDRLSYHEVYSDDGEDETIVSSSVVRPSQSFSDEVINDLSIGDLSL